jgi:hypothetical protein
MHSAEHHHDNRGRWIIIGGAVGATLGASTAHFPIALALGVAAGMTIGAILNRMTTHGAATHRDV